MSKYSVMIVDDSDTDRYLLKRFLGKTELVGHIFEQSSGVDALEFLGNYEANKKLYGDDFPPAILFLDINMPRINGFECLERLEKLKESVDIGSLIIMMFSSSEREEDMGKAFKYSFVKDFIVKGQINTEKLKDKILKNVPGIS